LVNAEAMTHFIDSADPRKIADPAATGLGMPTKPASR